MKKSIIRACAAAALAVTVASPSFAAERVFVGIATGGTGGTYYPLGGMLAQLISNHVDLGDKKLSATAETGNASVANAGLLGRGDIETAFVAADILDAAYHGKNQFEDKAQTGIRALGALYPETVQLVARGDAGLKVFTDLKGHSISSGSPGSGQWQLLGDILSVHGMERSDVSEDYSSFSQSAEKIADGNLDASLITAGSPTASITELANGHPVSIIPLNGPAIDKLLEIQPYYTKVTLPVGTYEGLNAPVETIAVRAIWATHEGVSDELAYALTKALYENTETLAKVHVKGKEISLETALQSISIPLHPGAERYYREKGLIK